MQQHPLFTFTDLQIEGNTIKADITLDPLHPIFEGHFPDNPILPGVCMVQMVKAAVRAHTHKKLRLAQGQDLKFLSVLSPLEATTIQLEFELKSDTENRSRVIARLLNNNEAFFKFKGVFVEV